MLDYISLSLYILSLSLFHPLLFFLAASRRPTHIFLYWSTSYTRFKRLSSHHTLKRPFSIQTLSFWRSLSVYLSSLSLVSLFATRLFFSSFVYFSHPFISYFLSVSILLYISQPIHRPNLPPIYFTCFLWSTALIVENIFMFFLLNVF